MSQRYEATCAALESENARLREDAARLDWLLSVAGLTMTEDGDEIGLFIGLQENIKAVAIVADVTGEDGEVTEEDAPWLTEAQRHCLSGKGANATGYVNDRSAVRAAIDAVRESDAARSPQESTE